MNTRMKDIQLDRQLKSKGYVVIPLLSEEELQEVIDFSERVNDFPKDQMFYSNMQHHDKPYVEMTRDFIKGFFWEKLSEHIENAELMDSVFINKPPGAGEFDNHQDWSIVDEKRVRTYCAWIPLIDVDEHNGSFAVLEGSQNFFQGYRSATTPWQYSGDEYAAIINKYRKPLSVKKGHALVFDNALIHATTANRSNDNRTVVMVGMKPKGEPIHHHYQTSEPNKVEVFEIDVNFFTTYDYKSRPSGYKSLGVVENETIDLSPAEMEQTILDFNRNSN